jgi:hypothetical protein
MDPSDRAVEQIQKRRAAIRQKIHPALPEIFERVRAAEKAWKALKKSDQTRERLGEIERKLDEELETIKRKHSGRAQAPKGTFGVEAVFREETLASQSDAKAVVEYLHWNRHKTSLTRDVQQMQSKDYEASKRVQRTSKTLKCCGAIKVH